jgi:hypothetical protein
MESKCGFRGERSCIDAIFSLKLILERRSEFNLETHLLFLDYEKTFDQVNRPTLFNTLHKRNIPDPVLSKLTKIYEHNEIKIMINNKTTQSVEINRGVRQGCPLCPTLFNIYINEIISKWNTDDVKGIQITRDKEIKTILFAEDQVLIAESEILLQKSVLKLENIVPKYGLPISTSKIKTMAFRGRHHIGSKIVINKKIIEHVNTFNYLGCTLSREQEIDGTNKLSKFLKITGIINQGIKPTKVQKQTRL